MKKLLYLFFACTIVLSLGSCAEDGEPGPAGTDGVDGQNGIDGVDGVDGEDGEGFEELTKDGNIMVYLDGKRPDGVAFKDTTNFKYTNDIQSTVQLNGEEEESYQIIMQKFQGPNIPFFEGGGYFAMTLESSSLESSADLIVTDMQLQEVVTTSDNKAFTVYTSFENEVDVDITEFSYDSDSGNLKFKFSYSLGANDNSTYYDLGVSGEVDIIVYEFINPR